MLTIVAIIYVKKNVSTEVLHISNLLTRMSMKGSTVVGYIDGAQPWFIGLTDGSFPCSNILMSDGP